MSVKGSENIDDDYVCSDYEIKNGIYGLNSQTWTSQLFEMNELEPVRAV
jgi:hypothetical protein